MNKPIRGLALILTVTLVISSAGLAQQNLTKEPEPSFREDAVSNHRHPEVDTDVFLYINTGATRSPRSATAASSNGPS